MKPSTHSPWLTPEVRNLDVLRAVAVSCVFFAHLSLFLLRDAKTASAEIAKFVLHDIGHIGVLFFFVHTALVLMLSLDRTPPRRAVLNFYIRRLFRIYPLSIVCVLAVLVFRVPQVPEGTFVPFDWREIVSNLLLIQNITQKADVIMPLWTLTREVQMYLALPLFYWIVRRFSSPVTPLGLWMVFFALTPHAPLLTAFPCFMGGVFAYQLARERVFRIPSMLWPLIIGALLAFHIVLAMTLLPDYRNDFILCMVLGALIPNVLDLRRSWFTHAAQVVAKYSYGVYLFHFPLIWLSFVQLDFLPPAARFAVLAISMIAVPVAAFHWIEQPLITWGRRLAARLSEPAHSGPAPLPSHASLVRE